MMKDKAIYTKQEPDKLTRNGWVYKTAQFEVRIMAVAEGYAMVRRKGAMPFICQEKDLSLIEDKGEG